MVWETVITKNRLIQLMATKKGRRTIVVFQHVNRSTNLRLEVEGGRASPSELISSNLACIAGGPYRIPCFRIRRKTPSTNRDRQRVHCRVGGRLSVIQNLEKILLVVFSWNTEIQSKIPTVRTCSSKWSIGGRLLTNSAHLSLEVCSFGAVDI